MIDLLATLQARMATLLNDARGQGLTEYVFILVLIAVVAIAALTFLGNHVTEELSTVGRTI